MQEILDYLEKHLNLVTAVCTILTTTGTAVGWIILNLLRKQKKEENSAFEKPFEKLGKDEEVLQATEEKNWRDNYPAALDCANWYRELLARFYPEVRVKFAKSVITLYVGGFVRAAVRARRNDRAIVRVARRKDDDLEGAVDYLKRQGVLFTICREDNRLSFDVDLQQLKKEQAAHEWIAQHLAPQYRIGVGQQHAG